MAEQPVASEKIPLIEKVGYSLADGAANFVFLTMVNYQASFYTDAMGISPAGASFIVLIARLWDAFFDPMMGIMADRTRTRWGRFRPWILWSMVPWAVFMVLAYTVPPFKSYAATYVYALVTNIGLMTLYSMNNTPYSALMAVITGDQKQRTSLSQYRFIAAMAGQLIVGGFTLALMNSLGGPVPSVPTDLAKRQLIAMTQPAVNGMVQVPTDSEAVLVPAPANAAALSLNDTPAMTDYRKAKQQHDARGWPLTMAVYAVICLVCFSITFLTVRERIGPSPKQAQAPPETAGPKNRTLPYATPQLATGPKNSFGMIMSNWPWLVMFLVTITHYVLSGIRGSAYKYYFDYLVDPGAMKQFIMAWHLPTIQASADPNKLDWWHKFLYSSKIMLKVDASGQPLDTSAVTAAVYGLLQMTNKVCNVVGIIAASGLIAAFSKKFVVAGALIFNTVFIVALYWIPINNIWGIYIVEWLGQLAYAPAVPLLWVLFADVCDFTEWKHGRNITGFIYSTFFFALKAGISLGSFLGLQVMSFCGYQANAIQTPQAKQGILLTLTLIPGIFSTACALSMLFYPVTKKMNNDIAAQLKQRRARPVSLPPGEVDV